MCQKANVLSNKSSTLVLLNRLLETLIRRTCLCAERDIVGELMLIVNNSNISDRSEVIRCCAGKVPLKWFLYMIEAE